MDALILELSSKEQELMRLQLESVDLRGKVRYFQRELEVPLSPFLDPTSHPRICPILFPAYSM